MNRSVEMKTDGQTCEAQTVNIIAGDYSHEKS